MARIERSIVIRRPVSEGTRVNDVHRRHAGARSEAGAGEGPGEGPTRELERVLENLNAVLEGEYHR